MEEERLYDATLECARNITRAIQNGGFKKSVTPNLSCVFQGQRERCWCQMYLRNCTKEQALKIVDLFNTWKPNSLLGRFGGVFFSAEKIMSNVSVCEE